MRKKKCKGCKEYFEPDRPFQTTCTWECALSHAKATGAKRRASEHRALKQKLNSESRQFWIKKVDTVFNAYIRKRDEKEPCISCQRQNLLKVNAGHYRPKGRNAQHRYNEDNVHKQCEACNTSLSGNLIEYRINLIAKIGIVRVEAIEQDNTIKKFTLKELKDKFIEYSEKIRILQ